MKAIDVYGRLNSGFIKEGITDLNWAAKMPDLDKYLHDDFKRSGMGLMCDFTDCIEKVYTTVFLSDRVLSRVLSFNVTNAMIFSHHPTNWDIEHHNGNYARKTRIYGLSGTSTLHQSQRQNGRIDNNFDAITHFGYTDQ